MRLASQFLLMVYRCDYMSARCDYHNHKLPAGRISSFLFFSYLWPRKVICSVGVLCP